MRSLLFPIVLLVCAIGGVVAVYVMSTRDRGERDPRIATGSAPLTVVEPSTDGLPPLQPSQVDRQRELLDVYFREVVPRLDQSLQRKRQATDNAVNELHRRLEGHRHGIDRFATDVTSWGTRFGVLGRMSKDGWRKAWHNDRQSAAARQYVQAKFRAHVMSERDLEGALEAAVQRFASDMEADRNTLFADIRLPLHTSIAQLRFSDEKWEQLRKAIMDRGGAIASAGATDTLIAGVTSFGASIAGEEAARMVVRGILVRAGPMIASRLAATGVTAAGGAMAGGATGGGVAGSLGGPAGTVVGVGVGIAVGAVIDWWMTERFKDKLAEECNRFIDNVQHVLIDGDGATQPGLRATLDQAVRLSDEAQRKAILEVLLREVGGGEPPPDVSATTTTQK